MLIVSISLTNQQRINLHMKIKLIFITLMALFTSIISADELGNLTTKQLLKLQKNSNALVIDIRTEKEWQATGTIPNSHKLQFFSDKGKYDTKKWLTDLKQLKSNDDQIVILVCRSGNRSGKVGNMLTQQLSMKKIYHLSNGMMSWIKAGNKTTKDCLPQLACK